MHIVQSYIIRKDEHSKIERIGKLQYSKLSKLLYFSKKNLIPETIQQILCRISKPIFTQLDKLQFLPIFIRN